MNYRLMVKGFLAVVLAGVTFLLLLEIGIRIIGYGENNQYDDFFNGFEGSAPAFIEKVNSDGSRVYTVAANRPLIPQSFPVLKKPKTFRIFTFGGSTTEGVPWGPKGAFSFWLDQGLKQMAPDWNIEVINCGVSGYGSSRVLVLLKEMVQYDPDLFIIYTGQNEFRDEQFHGDELNRTSLEIELLKIGFSSRAMALFYERFMRLREMIFGPQSLSYAAAEIEQILSRPFDAHTFSSFDYFRVPQLISSKDQDEPQWKVLAKWLLRRSDRDEEKVYKRFANNIKTMIDIAEKNKIKILFLSKAQNPMAVSAQRNYSVSMAHIRNGVEAQWRKLYVSAVGALKEGRCEDALRDFEGIKQLYKQGKDKGDSLLHLYSGECYARLGDFERAKVELSNRLSAQHQTLNSILKEILTQYGIAYIDVEELFSRHAVDDIIGYKNFFVDNAHMTVRGYQLIGDYLAKFIAKKQYINAFPTTISINSANSQEVNFGPAMEGQFDTATVHTSLAWSAFNQGKVEEAIGHGRKAVEKKNDAIQAHLLLGYAYNKMNRLEDARKEWNIIRSLWNREKA